ncbi:hypothetical protein BDN70DRAFT_873529 [Pholiota conissans]|uniref:Transmembrane protein n=1 Tax=Pholiota conissans TaxID=109636 RepID=A0A9P6D4N4_9AGAR|nr:hypothetical protein BDN70DRAFT_873529 [Pholiota conissans]
MINDRAVAISLGVLTLVSNMPTANAALSWNVCTKDENGKTICKSRIPRGARIAIAVVSIFAIILLFISVGCIIRNRRRAAAEEKEYNVEASQVQGPPTIIATEYNPGSGPSPVYSAGGGYETAQQFDIGHLSPSPQMSGPAFPASTRQFNNSKDYYKGNLSVPSMAQSNTAPVSQVTFPEPYPFGGYSPRNGPTPPKTAFVSHGFPRPLLAGDRLKDRLKERPSSVSSSSSVGR